MITEIAILSIDPADAENFEKTYYDVAPILREQSGYLGDRLMRAIERTEEYILTVEWGSVADHERFIGSPEYPDLDGALGKYVKEGSFAHYRTIAEST
jgi:heme-degrading monooxygenase HmoA